ASDFAALRGSLRERGAMLSQRSLKNCHATWYSDLAPILKPPQRRAVRAEDAATSSCLRLPQPGFRFTGVLAMRSAARSTIVVTIRSISTRALSASEMALNVCVRSPLTSAFANVSSSYAVGSEGEVEASS